MKRILLLFVLALAISAEAQSNYATVRGSVSDPQQRPLSGAVVEIKAASTGVTRHATSNEQGLFELPALLPDDYQLSVEAQGFAPITQSFQLEVGQQMTVAVTMKLGEVSQEVKVGAQMDVLHTADSSVGEVIEPTSIKNLPLNGRMLLDLALTIPGSHVGFGAQSGTSNPLYWRPGQRSAIVVSGNRDNANSFLLDGVTNTDPTFNTQNLSPSPDAVQEFQVQTSSYSAEMGGTGGGQINIVTHPGTSHFHGTAYEFLRNSAMDATTFQSMGANHLVQNNFGASFGGPMPKLSKTFFFLNYEGMRHAMADAQVETVPTMDEVMGDFSQSGHNIYDPASVTGTPSASNPRQQFSFGGVPNKIDPARISSVAQKFLMKYVPQPNMGMMGAGVDSNNYMDVRNELQIADQGTSRIDHVFNNGDAMFGRYSLEKETGFTPQNMPGFGAFHDNLSQQAAASWNHAFSSTKLNTVSFAVSRLSMNRTSQNNGVNDIVGQLGIQGVGFGGQGAWGAPWFAVQGYSGMGDSFAATPVHMWDTILEGRDVFAWQHGRHGLKIGGSYRHYSWPMWGFFQNRGFYQFTNGFTTQTGANDGTGSALASFLLGLPVVKQRQAGIPKMDLVDWGTDAFIQDTWQVTSNTTLNLGVRYEYTSPLWDTQYTNSNLVFQNGVPSVFIGGQNGYPKSLLYSNKHNFAPRIGVAKKLPSLGLVVHGAYGIFFTPVDFNTWCNQRHNVPYVFPETLQSNNFVPSLNGFDFNPPVLGQTTVSFAAFDPHAPAQYIQQWNAQVEKSLGKDTTLEFGYLGSRGFHLQRAHLINNAPPGPGPIGPRRPFKTLSFVPNSVIPSNVTVASTTFPVSGINLLENTAQSWYDAGYINVRRRYSHGLSLLANYTFAKNLTSAPDFRSPMDESAIPQNNSDLAAEKGPGCDVRHRLAFSSVYDVPAFTNNDVLRHITQHWQVSTIYQLQTGMPFTVSVFGDTANAGTLLGENPIRANYTGQPIFGAGTHTAARWFNPAAFATPPAFTFGDVGRNSVYGPSLQTLDLAVDRSFRLTESSTFEFRGEFFNALNHTNLGTPNRFVNEPQFGTITMAMTPGREVQLSARVSF